MKSKLVSKMAVVLGLTVIMAFSTNMAAMASTTATTPTVTRTKAWDGITQTLGGVPESVKKIEYKGSTFYLGKDVTEENFLSVLAAGAETVGLKPPQDNGKLYEYPIYILWNSDETALLVHPIIFDYDKVLETVATSAEPPASLTGKTAEKVLTTKEEVKNTQLNEHRVANKLKKLEVNLELQEYANIRAAEQRIKRGHTRPDGGAAGSGWHNSKNTMNSRYAENAISVGILNSDPKVAANEIFTRWKESAGHNRHMLYNFDSNIKMAFGIVPITDEMGVITSGAIFATGY